MRTRKVLAGAACLALAISLSACGSNGNRRDDDNDGGWFPVFIPWSQPHQTNNYYRDRDYRTPIAPAAPKAPAYRAPAPAYRAPAPRPAPMPRSK